jgi:hypothetical protein
VAGDFGRHRLYKMLGYFSLVGLLRLHSLLGDYHQALKVVENMNVNRKVSYCHILSDSYKMLVSQKQPKADWFLPAVTDINVYSKFKYSNAYIVMEETNIGCLQHNCWLTESLT